MQYCLSFFAVSGDFKPNWCQSSLKELLNSAAKVLRLLCLGSGGMLHFAKGSLAILKCPQCCIISGNFHLKIVYLSIPNGLACNLATEVKYIPFSILATSAFQILWYSILGLIKFLIFSVYQCCCYFIHEFHSLNRCMFVQNIIKWYITVINHAFKVCLPENHSRFSKDICQKTYYQNYWFSLIPLCQVFH